MDPRLETVTSLAPALQVAVRDLLARAFDDFSDLDWEHALGGHHLLAFDGSRLVAHAAVVPRTLWTGGEGYATGYVEAVAVLPRLQRRGIGTLAMRALEPVLDSYALGALSSSKHAFYESLGWERWRGPSYVLTAAGPVRSEDEDDGILVRRTARSATLDLTLALSCEDRAGDPW